VGPAHPRILLAHPRIKVKHIKNKIHLQYLSVCGLKSGPPQQKIIVTPLLTVYLSLIEILTKIINYTNKETVYKPRSVFLEFHLIAS
jgi:hypothetical protein